MNKTTCAVQGCPAPIKRGGYCYGHYMKNWRYGTPTPDHPPRWEDIRGHRFGALTVQERQGSQWLCRCDCGATTNVRAGDLNRGTATTCGDPRLRHRLDTAGYSAAHGRVRSDRGPASAHACTDCGRPAYHWSYDHDDPDELHEDVRGLRVAYSLNGDHYSPRCVSCHKVFDLGRLDAARATG